VVEWCADALVRFVKADSGLKERHLPSADEPPRPGLGKSGSLAGHGGNAMPPSLS